ncbi:MAG: T9SS type A sorting domain-containing protein [Bacteroidales bacterium]|nr:T9SS type A sorting domain-containing protein [Bacteroidales bacterium]
MNGQNVLEIYSISNSGKVSVTNLNSGVYLLKLVYKMVIKEF